MSGRSAHGRAGRRTTLVAGVAVFLVGARAARRGTVGPTEQRAFRAANRLPAWLHGPWWLLMQLGSLAGVWTVAAGAAAAGRPDLARRLGTAGTAAWLGAKAVKPFVGRGRPAAAIEGARVLGREQRGLGYPSGHAAVVACLYTVARPHLPRRWQAVALAAVAGVGTSRSYVGAHLPLDVVGGLALGAATGAAHESMSTPSRSSRSWRSWRRG